MYWGQAAAALAVAIGSAYVASESEYSTVGILAVAVIAYIVVRWLFAWIFRVRYWYQRGTSGTRHDWCPNCDSRRHRVGGDWILTCRRCGWKPGIPVVRWLTRSVPVRQFQRTVVGPRLIVVVLAVTLIAVGPVSLTAGLPTVVPDGPPDLSSGGDVSSPTLTQADTRTPDPTPEVTNTPQPNVGDTPDDPTEDLNATRIARSVHRFVNDHRTQRGLQPLAYDTELARIARYHSRDMATKGYFAHISPDGESMSSRYEQFDYKCRVSTGDNQYLTGAENIAYTYAEQSVETDRGIVSYDGNETKIARGLVTQWMNSPPHRENILTPEWDDEGLGIYIHDADDGTRVYATQNFC